MIRETQARDKSKIFIWNDRYLCSRSNPHKEAQQWVQERSHQVSSSQYVIVLGLACGYHIIELIKT